MASKIKVDTLETADGTGSIALSNQLSGMTVASLPTTGTLPALDGSSLTGVAPTKATIDALGIAASSITGALPAISGASLTNLPAGGKLLQLVSMKTITNTRSNSTSWVDLPITLNITPTLSTSKILVFANVTGIIRDGSSNIIGNHRLVRNGAMISQMEASWYKGGESNCVSIAYLDSPSTTSSTTYTVQCQIDSNQAVDYMYMNNAGAYISGGSTMVLAEISQ